MITDYNEIVNVNAIGKPDNPILMNDVLKMASQEKLSPASADKERVLFLAIDEQQDFMDYGALGVPGAHEDIKRITRFIYDNIEKITNIAVSLDTHTPHQIFHPCWWIDANGDSPAPYTAITTADLDAGKWTAIINPIASREYVEKLEKFGKKVLVVWPYHCIQGTTGAALENQFANMVYFHSVARKAIAQRLVKGQDPLTEMYGIIKPEDNCGPGNGSGYINIAFLNKVENYDKIVIAGEAKSHCVMESVKQILEYYENRPEVTSKIYILEDCMSSIPGYEDATDKAFNAFKTKYKINIVNSENFKL